jgi:hypothetical protein
MPGACERAWRDGTPRRCGGERVRRRGSGPAAEARWTGARRTRRAGWATATVELWGPCRRLAAKLDTERRMIECKRPRCSRERGETVFHYFDAESGEEVTDNSVSPPPTGLQQGSSIAGGSR